LAASPTFESSGAANFSGFASGPRPEFGHFDAFVV